MAEKIGKLMYGIGAVGIFLLAAIDWSNRIDLMIIGLIIVLGLVLTGRKLDGGESYDY